MQPISDMNALNNANVADCRCTGLTSFAFPRARSSTGESVEYIQDANKKWYVFRITYGKAKQVSDFLIHEGTYSYLAMVWKDVSKDGKRRRVKMPFLNLLFVYLTESDADYYVRQSSESRYITYYYNHFARDKFGKNPPLTVQGEDLRSLIIVTSLDDEHVMEVELSKCRFETDDLVLVTDGPFQGICGRVARVARQKRVVIHIQGLDSVITTAYIPTYCLEKL